MAKAPKTTVEAPTATPPNTDQSPAAAATAPDAATPPASKAAEPPAPKADPVTLPARIKMRQPHGFIDEEGAYGEPGKSHYWHQNQVVFEPVQIALLHERGANFEAVEDAPAKQ